MKKIRLGISKCLLGENVRYDGGHRLDNYLKDVVGKYVEWIGICPEVDCGLTVPREAMRLVGNTQNPRLVTIKTKKDYTEQMLSWTKQILPWLEKQNLCGFVFKSKSPSSGMRGVKIYDKDGNVIGLGTGIFAAEYMKYFPFIPVEDDGRLHNYSLRENFLTRVYIYHRWQKFLNTENSIKGLVDFHTNHKYLFMSHTQKLMNELGKLVANSKKFKKDELIKKYFETMMEGLKRLSSTKNNVNVLYHLMGYFKEELSSQEKTELVEIIENYKKGFLPLSVPKMLLLHYVKKYNKKYLITQYYLNPFPIELSSIEYS
ncbi:MAG: DUF523 and DUF1722 domain-containing protein [Endomicrobiia bacterium]